MLHDATRKRLLTVPEVAEQLGVSRAWAYRMALDGELPGLRLGSRRGKGQVLRVRPVDLDEWLERRGDVEA
jgi:excisionase family DNA binding protein